MVSWTQHAIGRGWPRDHVGPTEHALPRYLLRVSSGRDIVRPKPMVGPLEVGRHVSVDDLPFHRTSGTYPVMHITTPPNPASRYSRHLPRTAMFADSVGKP